MPSLNYAARDAIVTAPAAAAAVLRPRVSQGKLLEILEKYAKASLRQKRKLPESTQGGGPGRPQRAKHDEASGLMTNIT